MKRNRPAVLLLLAALFLVPALTQAAVRINEVAWMGSSENANAEWIELYNDGTEAVSLAGWTLTSAGTAPNITLSGTISAGGFYLLERTSDESASPAADKIYTGALSNAGDTLTLKNANQEAVDQVVGGSGWGQIGGDNTTKHTPQRTATGWVTAVPTPKAATTATADTDPEEEEDDEEEEDTSTEPQVVLDGTTLGDSHPFEPRGAKLYIDAGPRRIVLTNAPNTFRAVAYTKGKNLRWSRISWNFGDGTRELGDRVEHTYRYPGSYLVVVRASDGQREALAQVTVDTVDPKLSISHVDEVVLVLRNDLEVPMDISGWSVAREGRTFVFPPDSVIQARGAAAFTHQVTGLAASGEVTITYPDGTLYR